MQAIQVKVPGDCQALEVVEIPLPKPRDHEVRVKAQFIGISSADILIRKGIYSWMPALPAIPGNEMVGVIDAIGSKVNPDFHGQVVLVSSRELDFRGGCYAQAICVSAASVFILPKSINPIDAVCLPNYQLAGAMLYHSGIRPPKSVVIYGAAGGVGFAISQLAMADGIQAISIVSSDEKKDFVKKSGIQFVLNRNQDDLVKEVMEITDGQGVDLVCAMAGKDFIANLDLLAPLGTLLSFGILGGIPEDNIFTELRKRLGKSLGVRVYSIHTLDHDPELRRGLMTRAIDLLAKGQIRPQAPTVFKLSEACLAHECMESGTLIGKLVLVPDH
jgi:NADPH:quinone reductase